MSSLRETLFFLPDVFFTRSGREFSEEGALFLVLCVAAVIVGVGVYLKRKIG